MSDPTDVASDAATDAATDDVDDDAPRLSARRRREPCCLLVDVLRAMLVRGTYGIGGRCGRRGGMRDARGGGEGGGGRALLLNEEEEAEVIGFGTPRMCTMPAPSRVSSSDQGFEVVDAVDGARAMADAACCQLYAVTLGRTGAVGTDAGVAEGNPPSAVAMLFRSESRQDSIVPGCEFVSDSTSFADERSRRSLHRL